MATVAVEKLGSSSVHLRIVPAGRTTSRALALRVKVKQRRDTATTAHSVLAFMNHLVSRPKDSWNDVLQQFEPAPIA